jgi:hypothetical protein
MSRRLEQRLIALERRRGLLIERAEVQRLAMAEAAAGLERPLHWLDAGMSFANSMRPAQGVQAFSLLGAMLSLSAGFARPRAWVARGLMLYQIAKFIHSRYAAHAHSGR